MQSGPLFGASQQTGSNGYVKTLNIVLRVSLVMIVARVYNFLAGDDLTMRRGALFDVCTERERGR